MADEALASLPDLARRGGRMAGLKIPGDREIDAELADGEALDARLICACEPDFPPALAAILLAAVLVLYAIYDRIAGPGNLKLG